MTIFNSYSTAQRTTKHQLCIDAWFQQNQEDEPVVQERQRSLTSKASVVETESDNHCEG